MRGALRWGLWTHLWIVLFLLYGPLAVLLIYSFNGSKLALRWEGFSWEWYERALQNPEVLTAISNSMGVALLSAAVATLLGTLLALALERGSRRLKGSLQLLALLPIVIPEIILGIGLLVFFARFLRPVLANFGFILDSLGSVVLGHVTLALSYVMVAVRGRLKTYNAELELAAMDLGASNLDILTRIILPQLSPAIFSGFLMAVSLSLDDFYISYFVTVGGSGFKTVPLYIWALQGRTALTPEINAVSVLMLVFSGIFMAFGAMAAKGIATKKGEGT